MAVDRIRQLEVQNLERVRVRSGPDTVEKLTLDRMEKFLDTPTGKAFEAVLRLKYRMLKGGGIVASPWAGDTSPG